MSDIALRDLDAWIDNPRTGTDAQHIGELKASIQANGVLQNLIAVPDRKNKGRYLVIAGRSRLTALRECAAEGSISEDAPVPVVVRDIDVDDAEALMVSLSENVVRRQMEPIDECVAMRELVRRGSTAENIAAAFGCSVKTVRQRLAIGGLATAAQDLIRAGIRDLDWGRALTLADAALQNRICSDVTVNPGAWRDGAEIRRYLTSETIPAEHALFDLKDYRGRILFDMFGSDQLAGREEFWELQDAAIEAMASEIALEGWSAVEVSRNPVDLWRYRRSDDPAASKALIEVSPNGKTTVHRGLVEPVETAQDQPGLLDSDGDDGAEERGLAGDAVRLTPAVAEYAASHRSAMAQAALASNFRAALEVAAAGLIGHGGIAIRAHDHRFLGGSEIRTGGHFEAVSRVRGEVEGVLRAGGVPACGRDDGAVLAAVRALSDEDLQALFAKLTAMKIGQAHGRGVDSDPTSLLNSLGSSLSIDPRADWTPDEPFFDLMTAQDLRRLAASLLPRSRQAGVLSAKKPHLVRMLSEAFADAKAQDGSLDAADAAALNAWVPGPLRFPAEDDADRAAAAFVAEDAEDALFGGADEALFGGAGEASSDAAEDALFDA